MKAKRIVTKIGDIFSVKIDNDLRKFFQLIAYDLTQLNSDVIRAFKNEYPITDTLGLSEIVSGEIEFYAHCVTKLGVKLGYWEKIGNINDVGKTNHILFRSSGDYGNPAIKISKKWWVWKINEEQRWVGKLEGENRKAEIGSVMSPDSIVYRMKTCRNDFFYPDFE